MEEKLHEFSKAVASYIAEYYKESARDSDGDDTKLTEEEISRLDSELSHMLNHSKIFEEIVLTTLQDGGYFEDFPDRESQIANLDLENVDWFLDDFFDVPLNHFERRFVKEIARRYPEDKTDLVRYMDISRNSDYKELSYLYNKERNKSRSMIFKLKR